LQDGVVRDWTGNIASHFRTPPPPVYLFIMLVGFVLKARP